MQGIKKIIRSELKLHDEYTSLKEDVEIQRKRMWGALHKIDDVLYAYNPELQKTIKKSNEATYKMYEGWLNDAREKLEEFEKKNGY